MVRRRFHPLIAFALVIAAAGSVTAAGLTFTAHTVSKTVAELPKVTPRTVPSYVVRLPEAKAADLDISKSVEVNSKVKAPVVVPPVPVTNAAAALPATLSVTTTEPTLVAEATPLTEAPAGDHYVVKTDVFVRSGPSKSYGQVGTVSGGTEVNVTKSNGGWLQVSYSGGSGWVYERYLTRTGGEQVADAEGGRAPF